MERQLLQRGAAVAGAGMPGSALPYERIIEAVEDSVEGDAFTRQPIRIHEGDSR
jgi:hypothetical protein